MSDKPSPIIPVPKHLKLRSTDHAWPRRISIESSTSSAAALEPAFRETLAGRGDGTLTLRLCDRRSFRPSAHTAAAAPVAGAYAIEFTPPVVTVASADPAGFRHAWATLRPLTTEPTMPTGVIEDRPALAVRGIHLNVASCLQIDIDSAIRLIEMAARFKLNAVLVEYGPRFPFEQHEFIRDARALSSDDVWRLNAAAAEHGIEVIPLQQCLAHLEYALGHERLAHLRERPDKSNLMCPCDPGSLGLFKALSAEIIARHPGIRRFHLGGDEARKFGRCPRCQASVKEKGIGRVYGEYVVAAARWLLEQGLRPIVWDDVFCAYPEALEQLPKETIIQYWDYIAVADPTPVLIPRMAHADGGPRVAHDWHWSMPGRQKRLSDVQRQVMADYSKPVRMGSALGTRFFETFGPYLGRDFPRFMRALPYIEYYRDRGHQVITSPTGMGNGDTADGVPNFMRFEHNICTHAARCKESGALGLITTFWYNVPVEMMHQPLIQTAQGGW